MGNPHPVSMANLTYLANTSRWAPEDAANYRVIRGPDEVGLYKSNPVVTHSLKPPGFNP